MNEPRNWKWMVPSTFTVVFLVIYSQTLGWGAWAWIWVGLAIICGLAGLMNFWLYLDEHVGETRRELILTQNRTSMVMTMEAASRMHPDGLRLLFGERARRLGLISGSQSIIGKPYAVLMARPRVTVEFFVHFLRQSNGQMYMPKRMLSDGDKSWDPAKATTAYEMFEDVESLLFEEMKATRPFGATKPGYWINEWDPFSVGMDFGINIDSWDEGGVHAEKDERELVSGRIPMIVNGETWNGGVK